MSNILESEIIDTVQIPVWCYPTDITYSQRFWEIQWRIDREKDLQDARDMLAHLTEDEDWFFVNVDGLNTDVFFTDSRQAVLFKLRHVI